MLDLPIFIPTRGRAGYLYKRGGALRQLSRVAKCVLIVRREDAEEYAPAARKYGVAVETLPAGFPDGVGAIRDWICAYAKNAGFSRIAMADDDIQIYAVTETGKTASINNGELLTALQECSELVRDDVILAGFQERLFCNSRPRTVTIDAYVIRFFYLDVNKLSEHGVTFDWPGRDMDDYHAQLLCLRKGLHIARLGAYCVGDSGSQAPGGCSLIRTAETQTRAAQLLAAEFPERVRLYWKTDRMGTHAEVKIYRKSL